MNNVVLKFVVVVLVALLVFVLARFIRKCLAGARILVEAFGRAYANALGGVHGIGCSSNPVESGIWSDEDDADVT